MAHGDPITSFSLDSEPHETSDVLTTVETDGPIRTDDRLDLESRHRPNRRSRSRLDQRRHRKEVVFAGFHSEAS